MFNIFDSFNGDEDVPAPGTPPTYDDNGVMTDPGNPWIGFQDPQNPARTIPASGLQRRRVARAAARREAAEQRVGQRAYNRSAASIDKAEAQARQRRRIITGEVKASPGLLRNVVADENRRRKAGDPEIAAARAQDHRDDLQEARLDRAEERRIRRFKEGRPRGKDLREATFKQFSHYLPASYWRPKNGA